MLMTGGAQAGKQLISGDQVRAYKALLSAATLLQRAVDQQLRVSAGLTHAQFEILARLGDSPDGVRMTDIARELILSRSGATYRIQQLALIGYVSREQDPQDDRGVIAHLTPAGADALARAVSGHVELVQTLMFDALTGEQTVALADGLEAIAGRAQNRAD